MSHSSSSERSGVSPEQEDLPSITVSSETIFPFLKGIVSRDKILFEGTTSVPVLSVHELMVFTIFCFLVD